ncbi:MULTISPECIES: DUF885 domain-containing protein [unclassified Saccharothrix]|uniref:DUF885 domain-containing protein n=1 Tax=unclassified Saccharothrix TaxID=2593673 RepID=UPI00307F8577
MSVVRTIADELHETLAHRSPTTAARRGTPGDGDRLPDFSENADAEFDRALAALERKARAVDPRGLTTTDRITRDVVLQQVGAERDRIACRWVESAVSDAVTTPVPDLLLTLATLPVDTRRRRAEHLRRIRQLPEFFRTLAERHRAGIAAGRTPVARLVKAAIKHLDNQHANIDDLCRGQGREIATTAILTYRDMLLTEVLPHGRDDDHAGACRLPGGEAAYETAVRAHTTTALSAQRLHRVGLDVLAGLSEEFTELGWRVFRTGHLPDVFARLRDDPALRWHDGAEMLAAAREAVRRAEVAAPQWFHRVPTRPCEIAAYPKSGSPTTPPAYRTGSLDGSRPGTYYLNTKRPGDQMRYKAEVTAFHEGVPGHHLEVSLRQERADLPVLRRTVSFDAFADGWALYAERLADEMGLYSDDLSRLGMLALDCLRAARLVVDTGLHANGWTRRGAVAFLRDHTPLGHAAVEAEVDRYLSAPGQALAYLVGRLEIQRLRASAERVLGPRFDPRDFHEVVLSEGPVPLGSLAELVTVWMSRLNVG